MAINRDLRISKVNPNDVEKIKRISAYDLPNNPSARGMTPDEIRGAFWRPLVETGNSLVNEIDKLAARANEYIDSVADHVGDGDVPDIPESLKKFKDENKSGLTDAVAIVLKALTEQNGPLAMAVINATAQANAAKAYANTATAQASEAKSAAANAKKAVDEAKDLQSRVSINIITWEEGD